MSMTRTPWIARKRILFLSVIAGALFTAPLNAGSVFLKNGYIIQGRVVERDPDKIVLGWLNGKMTIYRRFIQEVILDPREEADLRRAVTAVESAPQPGSTLEPDLDLPERLEEIIAIHTGPMVTPPTQNPTLPSDSVGVESIPPGDPVRIIPHLPALPEERRFPELGVAMRVPPDWDVNLVARILRLQKNRDTEFPNLTLQFSEDAIDNDTARRILKETLVAEFSGLEISSERTEQIGFERAYVLEGEYKENRLYVSQVLLRHESRYYLIGLQAPIPVNPDDLSALEQSLHSLRFVR